MTEDDKVAGWRVFTHSALPVRLQYPIVTPGGLQVSIKEIQKPDSYRAHLISTDRSEVYFEVGYYTNLSPKKAFQDIKKDQISRSADLEVHDLVESQLVNCGAYRSEMHWPDRSRVFYFVPLGESFVRIIFNPISPVNHRILSTLEIFESLSD